jgi:hypothetical protein
MQVCNSSTQWGESIHLKRFREHWRRNMLKATILPLLLLFLSRSLLLYEWGHARGLSIQG